MNEVNKHGRTVWRSRWGFNPVSYEAFRKLKALHKMYWEAVRENANRARWERKQPQNRRGEPPHPNYEILHSDILIAYQEARIPLATLDEVPPIRMTDEEVERLLMSREKIAA